MIKTAKELPRRFSEYPWFRRTTPSHRTSAPAPPPRSLTVGAKSTSASAAVTNEPVSAEHIINAQPVFSFHHHHHHHHHVEEGKKEVQTGLASSSIFAGLLQKWKSLSNATRFGFLCIFLRLLLLPAISFLIVYGLLKAGILPSDPSFVISILIGISSPAAVNGSLICTMHGYFATQYARMIFLMYCLAVLSSALWLTISVYYAGLLNASQHAHQ
ncbi:hypothetical protein ADEAN_000503300 [Angomonas deanei]|uniref:Membrane transport protein n=1 Tax=Angomonas deanei TaxID=59799 RepID=A0A7G2CDT8_9TRYP|nr:hypothetical protein ADEAN_000503300 [Angomonas deanei]